MNNEKKIRTNIFLAEDIKVYVDGVSNDMGMSNSAFITMCINQYKQQDEVRKLMFDLKHMINDLKCLKGIENKCE